MILHSPESAYAQERRKWEALPSNLGPGERPWVHRDYPWMMYRASSPTTLEIPQIAADEQERAALTRRGYFDNPDAAIQGYEAQQLEFAKLAAEREHEIRYKLSDKAVAEVRAAEAEHLGHLPTIPETPLPPKSGLASWTKRDKDKT